MDTELRGQSFAQSWPSEVAQLRFNELDKLHRGYLAIDPLPRTPAEDYGGGGNGKKHH